MSGRDEHTLEFLLAFDGRIHHLEQGYWLKFEIKRIEPTPERPHGLRYSFTLHNADGKRLMGFDNAHGVAAQAQSWQLERSSMITGIEQATTRGALTPLRRRTRCSPTSLTRYDGFSRSEVCPTR